MSGAYRIVAAEAARLPVAGSAGAGAIRAVGQAPGTVIPFPVWRRAQDIAAAARALERGRQPAPTDQAMDLALAVMSLHPAIRVARAAMLVRELWRIMQGGSPVMGPLIVFPAGGGQPAFGPRWSLQYSCGSTGGGWWLGAYGACLAPGTYGTPFDTAADAVPTYFAGMTVTNADGLVQIPGTDPPVFGVPGTAETWRFNGPGTDVFPGIAPGAPVLIPGASGAGLIQPMSRPGASPGMRAALQEAAGLLRRPNAELNPWASRWAVVEAAQGVRLGEGTRVEEVPGPKLPPRPTFRPDPLPPEAPPGVVPPGEAPVNWGNLLPAISGEYARGEWRQAQAHRYKKPGGRVREKKLSVRGQAWRVFGLVANAFTETNDFINGIWRALPRKFRRAGLTSTFNRRTDSMLNDIYRGWDYIDWAKAAGNVAGNQVEDYLIGRSQSLLNRRGSQASGAGFGTTYSRLNESMYSWTSDVSDWVGRHVERTVRNAGVRPRFSHDDKSLGMNRGVRYRPDSRPVVPRSGYGGRRTPTAGEFGGRK